MGGTGAGRCAVSLHGYGDRLETNMDDEIKQRNRKATHSVKQMLSTSFI